MQNGIHFISGLPRSGSTLLAAILRQNPRFHAGMTSPVGAIYMALEGAMSRRNEAAVFIKDSQRRDILKGLFASYYPRSKRKRSCSTPTGCGAPSCRPLRTSSRTRESSAALRDICWIMDSIERLVRKNRFELSGMFGFEAGHTVYTRINRVATSDGIVGYPLDALREAFSANRHQGWFFSNRGPGAGAGIGHELLYDFIGEPYFPHNFEHVEYEADDFDAALGTPGLHVVRGKVQWTERQSVLPPSSSNASKMTRLEGAEANIRQVPSSATRNNGPAARQSPRPNHRVASLS